MMLRNVMLVMSVVATITTVKADQEDPLSWQISKKWAASVSPTPTSYLIHHMRPAWTSTEPVLIVTDRAGKVANHGLIAEDIRAVARWRDRFVAVRVVADGADVLVLNANLAIEAQSPIGRATTIGHDDMVSVHSCDNSQWVFVRIAGVVIAVDPMARPLQPKLLEDGVRGIATLSDGPSCLAIVHDVGGVAFVSVLDAKLNRRIAPSVPLASRSRVEQAER